MVAGDQLSVATAVGSFADKNAGASKTVAITGITLGGQDAANYTLQTSTASAQANISPAQIAAVTGITAANKTYDGTTAAALTTSSAGFTGMVAGDQLSVAAAVGAFADKNAGTDKTVSVTGITLGGLDARNYTLATPAATAQASIDPRLLSMGSLVVADKIYDGSASATVREVPLQGVLAGDVVSVTLSTALASFSDRNAGTGKAVSISGLGLAGADAGNYRLGSSAAQAAASITPRSVALGSLTVADKVYDGTTTARVASGALEGLIAGDVVSLDLARALATFADRNVGTDKAVAVSALTLSGADSANYLLGTSSAAARGTITVRPQSTWTSTVGGNWSDAANWDVRPDGSNVASVVLPAGAGGAVTFDLAAPAVSLRDLTVSRNFVVAAPGLLVDRLDNRAETVLAAGVNWDLSRRTVVGSGTFTNRGALTLVDGVLENALFNDGGSVAVGGRSRLGPVTNAGRFSLQPGALVNIAGAYRQTSGLTTLGAQGAPVPTLTVAADSSVAIEGGELAGSGTIGGSLTVGAARLAPGYSPGAIAVSGNVSLSPGTTTLIEIGGTQPGGVDFLDVAGQAGLDGTLRLASHGGFAPTGSERFVILRAGGGVTGGFATFINDDPLLANLSWSSVLMDTPDGLYAARPLATNQVDAMLSAVKSPPAPTQPLPTPPTLAALSATAAAASASSGSPGGPVDPLPIVITKAGESTEEGEPSREAGDGMGPPAPAAGARSERPFVEDRPALMRGAVRTLEFEAAPEATASNPATREVDRLTRERPSSGC